MTGRKQLHIGLSLSATWLRGAGWRQPGSRVEELFSSGFYTEMARKAEEAKLDFVFRADSLFVDAARLGADPGFSGPDPTILLASIASRTSHIGLVSTASTTFNAPYVIARQLQSLNWASDGRAGWNVVTALDGERNFGVDTMPDADWRYERAGEFVEIVRRLWASYPADALVMDRKAGRFADTERIAPIHFKGRHFSVEGPLTLPGHPAGRIPLFQAGASNTGREFAASIADAIFAATPAMEAAIELRADLRSRAERLGRAPDAIRLLPGLSLALAPTRKQAYELFREVLQPRDRERAHAFLETVLGIDTRELPQDEPIPLDLLSGVQPGVRSRTHAEMVYRIVTEERPTVTDLVSRPEATGSAHWQIVGAPEDAAREIRAWHDAGAMDGFIALPVQSLDSLDLTVRELVPMLAEMGLFRTEYWGATLADHLGLTDR